MASIELKKEPAPRPAGRFCVNCGAPVIPNRQLCLQCWSDPILPLATLGRRVPSRASRAAVTRDLSALRHSDELAALSRAILLGALLVVVLGGLTLGTYVVLLTISLLAALVTMHRIAGQAADIRTMRSPRLRNLVTVACARLALPIPRAYLQPDPSLNAFTMGLGRAKIMVLNAGLVENLPPDEILFVVGHELGHVKFEHTTWLTLTSTLRLQPLRWLGELMRLVFNDWSLKAEYTADRAGLVAVGARDPAISALNRVTTGHGLEDPVGAVPERELADRNPAIEHVVEHLGSHPFLANRIRAVVEFSEAHADLLDGFAERLPDPRPV
jgi:Zn-dependent protease with chaperone function